MRHPVPYLVALIVFMLWANGMISRAQARVRARERRRSVFFGNTRMTVVTPPTRNVRTTDS
jgi:hypothetical protein